jgi:superfamily II DNA helicase RecQ
MFASIGAGAQRGGGKSPIRSLLNDLQQAIPRATLTAEQNTKIQTDISSMTQAMRAKRQGQSVDQDQLKATIDDLHQVVDSGTFQDGDQKQLDQDFAALQPQ